MSATSLVSELIGSNPMVLITLILVTLILVTLRAGLRAGFSLDRFARSLFDC